ncbi:MAG TPA: hypothetical protein VGJ90_13320 [Methylophilaceae bacterium]|jgi:hypothetical protein
MPLNAKFIYMEYGDIKRYKLELIYSLATLFKHHTLNKSDVVIYTATPDFFKSLGVTVISIKELIPEYSQNWSYTFRVKPCVMLDALRTFRCPILFLDTDTIIEKSLLPILAAISPKQVFLNRLEKINPYPSIKQFDTMLPNSGHYAYSPKESHMYNSGIIGASEAHIPIFEDAIYLLDALKAAGVKEHTVEQTALSEVLRINNIRISEVISEIKHYCRGADKEFMAHQLFKRLANWDNDGLPDLKNPIKLSYLRSRIFKRLKIDLG